MCIYGDNTNPPTENSRIRLQIDHKDHFSQSKLSKLLKVYFTKVKPICSKYSVQHTCILKKKNTEY